ncbi:MAG: IPT/TIG domain-containing protein, partial [bacterium]
LNLFSPVNAIINRLFATGTIVNDDGAPSVTTSDVRIVEGNSGTTNAVITLTASQPFTGEVDYITVDGTAKNGSDYLSRSGALIFNAETTKTISIPIVGDTQPEPDEAFTVHLSILTFTGPQFILAKENVNVVIATDDAGIGPSELNIPIGSKGQLTASFGSSNTPQTVTLTSSNPNVATVPASVQITGTGQIDVTGLQAGHATITATVPPAFGSVSTLIDVNVYEPANLVLNPISLTVPTGFNATISASFNPALTAPDGATLSIGGNGSITFPDHISIDAAKSSTFTIKGVTPGLVLLTATLGSNHGHTSTFISVLVTEPPTTPSITQISPANGPAAGGTNVTLNGTNLRADCTIRFGGVAATNVAYVSATSMTATTPGHAAGTTDVSLVCGADTFNLTNAFTYLAASATLSGVSPSFGTTAGGTVVKITGTNFTNGCWPFFDALAAHNAYLTAPTEIIAATPAHPSAATVPLMLRCGGAPDVSLADAFTYSIAESSPVITTVDPLVGSAGKSVTISGARFRFDDVVTFDSTPAVILSTSPGTH